MGFWGHFSAIFLHISPVRPQAIFRPFLPDFGPKARRQSVAGQRELNPFVLQYASHLYGSTFQKILGAGVTGQEAAKDNF